MISHSIFWILQTNEPLNWKHMSIRLRSNPARISYDYDKYLCCEYNNNPLNKLSGENLHKLKMRNFKSNELWLFEPRPVIRWPTTTTTVTHSLVLYVAVLPCLSLCLLIYLSIYLSVSPPFYTLPIYHEVPFPIHPQPLSVGSPHQWLLVGM